MSGKINRDGQLNDKKAEITDEDFDGYVDEIENFCMETQMLSADSEIFLTDIDGDLLYSNNSDKACGQKCQEQNGIDALNAFFDDSEYGMEDCQEFFSGALTYIEKKQHGMYFENLFEHNAYIYNCDSCKDEYITVGWGYGASVKCVKFNLTENGCENLKEFSNKLENTDNYIKHFSKKQNVTSDKHPAVVRIKESRQAVDELIDVEKECLEEEKVVTDVGLLINLICTALGENAFSESQRKVVEEKRFVSYVALSCSKAILYTLAFMVKNSRSGSICMDTKLLKNKIKFIFAATCEKSSSFDFYRTAMTNIISKCDLNGKIKHMEKELKLEIHFPLCPDKMTVQECDDVEEKLLKRIYGKKSVNTFKFIAGV